MKLARYRSLLLADTVEKVEMPPQQNSRKSELIAGFGWRCPLKVCGKAAE
jgi:hypothetical protein